MSPVHLRNQPADRERLFRTRIPVRGHLGHSGGWQNIELNHTHSAIHFQIQQKPQTRVLEGYGSSSSAPPTPQRSFPMENGQQGVQPSSPLGRTWSRFLEDTSQRDTLKRPYVNHQSYKTTAEPDRAYSYSFRITRSKPNKLSSGLILFRNQQISCQESPFFTIPGISQKKTRIQGRKQDIFQPEAERVRNNDPEAVGLGERSTQESEIALITSRIIIPTNRNITPTQKDHNVVTPESNLNSEKLLLQMSQFSVQTQAQLDDFKILN
ncbi:hypothetical protein O181_027562 [Austropuccinia psidii MF-1]|uniref:Uncharacterized protein n=1 Tax=Austropuccinia psidii MF-1 TaxID=1389203 RepID=A0A9Q3CSV3_9BASI|nr:hypothetical protein [Austropuccinia psidii MF-1]